ncbi:MAG: glycosyltransferase family 4 protein [Gemmobacter sp.]
MPSGDRLMARLLLRALGLAGHRVTVVSDLRAFLRDPGDDAGMARIEAAAQDERRRIADLWRAGRVPDLWLAYHPYYKAPDLIGPDLCAAFGVAYATVETSYSQRRNLGHWAGMQARVLAGIEGARVNICLTARDAAGIRGAAPGARLARLAPFIDLTEDRDPLPETGHLVAVAMMRPGDKMESYRHLAAALARVPGEWHLSVAGDGEMRGGVEALFARFGHRVRFLGLLAPTEVAGLLARASVYLWPGCGEAYGLAYLEAQAASLPVVACEIAGVPEVVAAGETGLLVPPGDAGAYAGAVARLLGDHALRARMGQAARARVLRDHSMAAAAARLDAILRGALGR